MGDRTLTVGVLIPHVTAGPEIEIPVMSAGQVATLVSRVPLSARSDAGATSPQSLREGARPTCSPHQPKGEQPDYSLRNASTEISTAGTSPRFSSQWRVFRSSGQPRPGPYSVVTPSRWVTLRIRS